MWLVNAVLRRPDHGGGRHPRDPRSVGARHPAHEGRHLPAARLAHHLRRPALRRHGPVADGRLPHLLLRVPLPLHHRHRARRVEEHSGRVADEAGLPPRHRHEPGDGRGGRLRQSRRAPSCRPAPCRPFITRFDAGSVPVGQLVFSSAHTHRRARCRTSPSTACGRCSPRSPGVSAPPPFGGNQRTDRRARRPGPAARLRHLARRSDHRGQPREHRRSVGQRARSATATYIATTNAVLGGRPRRNSPTPPIRQERHRPCLPPRHRHHRERHRHRRPATRTSTASARSTSR